MCGRPPLLTLFPYTTLFRSEFAIGLAAGIIFDATVIRALMVPALMRVLGEANWWMPQWTRRALFIRGPERAPETAARSEEHTSELQSLTNLVCRLLLERKKD